MATNTYVTAQKKALFIAEGVTLAHVGRSIRLASILQRDGVDVELACDRRYARFLTGLDFPVRSIRSIPSDTFLDVLARGRPVFSTETLRAYVSDDLSLLGSVKPDVVLGDFRLSLSVSARVAGERKPEISEDNVGFDRPEQRQVVAHVSAQRLSRENGASPGQHVEKGIAGDRADGADGEIEAGEEPGVAAVASELDVDPIALQNRCQTNRAAYMRERNPLGDEQRFFLRGHVGVRCHPALGCEVGGSGSDFIARRAIAASRA